MTSEELLERANKAINELFGLSSPKRTRGPDDCLRLYTVSWRGEHGNEHVMFKHKKTAYEFFNRMKQEHNGQAGIIKARYDCQFIAEEGIEEMYKEYDIKDWSLKEFRKYVEYHKNF